MALPASGRLRVIQATPSSTRRRTASSDVGGPGGERRRHQMRWMMFIREVQTGSPVARSLHAVSTTTKVMVLPFDSFR